MNVTHKCSYYLNLNFTEMGHIENVTGENAVEDEKNVILSSRIQEEPDETLSPMDTLSLVANFNKATLLNNKE